MTSTNSSVFLASRALIALVLAILAVRLGVLALSSMELHGDEAQYWDWSRRLEFGYFSKPPLVAWIIALATALLGDTEFGVRIAAPFLHAFGALAVGAVAAQLAAPAQRESSAFFAGATYLLMPGIWLSSGIMSTDAILLPIFACSLLTLLRFEARPSWGGAVLLGVLVGLGFLAKYAMFYFLIGMALAAAVRRETRMALLSGYGLAALVAFALVLSPNLFWNALNGFATVGHTAANANWGGPLFNPVEVLEFWGDQIALFGPLGIVLVAFLLWQLPKWSDEQRHIAQFLACFILPALVVVSVQGFISRANGNWAASLYIGLSVLVGLAVVWGPHRRLWRAMAVMHLLIGILISALALSPALVDAAGLANGVKRARGWQATAEAVRAVHEAGDYHGVMADNRLLYQQLKFYTRDNPLPLRMWQAEYPAALSHAEASAPIAHGAQGPYLLLNERAFETERLTGDFEVIEPLNPITIVLGGGKERVLRLYRAEGFTPAER
jgi:4-amino-4-deoxy-L-arabinose transferase-like glycosyltransferase